MGLLINYKIQISNRPPSNIFKWIGKSPSSNIKKIWITLPVYLYATFPLQHNTKVCIHTCMGWDGIYWVRASCLWKWWDPGCPAHLFPVLDIQKCHRNSIYHLNPFCCILSGPITRYHPVSVFSSLEGPVAAGTISEDLFWQNILMSILTCLMKKCQDSCAFVRF